VAGPAVLTCVLLAFGSASLPSSVFDMFLGHIPNIAQLPASAMMVSMPVRLPRSARGIP
jgi:hypothetical protein